MPNRKYSSNWLENKMLSQKLLEYTKGSDFMQTRTRHPRNVMPNFALYCDWIIWDANHTYIDLSKEPKTIYVRSDIRMLIYFSKQILHRITNNFILVTTSHDLTMPMGFAREFNFDWKAIIANKYLKMWFTENRDLVHDRIKPLTLGLPCPDLPSWVLGSDTGTISDEEIFQKTQSLVKSTKIFKIFGCWFPRARHLSGISPRENSERQIAYDYFTTKKDLFDWYQPNLSRLEFLKKMGEYQFVLCPHGGGLDPNPKCWEALIMKAIPIVKRNSISESFEHLPVLIVDEWQEITIGTLRVFHKENAVRLHDKRLTYLMSNSYYYNKIIDYL